MNALDMIYHLATSWAVHLNYVAVKLTCIFLSVFLITLLIGKGKEEGVVASILGPFVFYLYYLFAGATLNRDVFRLDEQFWFFFLHLGFMLFAYFITLKAIQTKEWWACLLTVWWSMTALMLLYIMMIWRFQGVEEEIAATNMTFTLALPILLILLAGFSLGLLFKKNWAGSLIVGIGISIVQSIPAGVFAIIMSYASWKALELVRHETT